MFQYVENDAELMHNYLRLVSDRYLYTVNKALGRKIKEKFGVEICKGILILKVN